MALHSGNMGSWPSPSSHLDSALCQVMTDRIGKSQAGAVCVKVQANGCLATAILSHSVIIPSPPPSLFQLWHGAMQIPNQPHLRRVHREATEREHWRAPGLLKQWREGSLELPQMSKSLPRVPIYSSATLLQQCLPTIARLPEG